MGFLSGGSKQQSSSYNTSEPLIDKTFGGAAGATGQATGALSSLLGLGGGLAQNAAFNNFKDSTGYQSVLKSGQDAITSNQAAKGLFNSGATGKALVKFGSGLGEQYLNNFMQNLQGLGQLGLGAGGLITQAGQKQNSSGSSKNGLGGLLGGATAGIL